MKKIFFFLSAFALLGLTACVEQMPVNPNYNAERGEVKTNFIINVATEAQTKAAAADVQAGTAFRGMEQIKLFVTKGYGTDYLAAPYQFDLGTLTPIYGEDNLTEASAIDASNSRRVYKMTLPTGVDNMMFYAKAKAGREDYNKTTYTVTADKTTTNFKLEAIAADADFTKGSAKTILEILNAFSDIIPEWQATDDPASTTADVTLGNAFKNYFTTGETLRQGSGKAVLRTMQDLYNIVAPRSAAATNNTPADPCQAVCANIKGVIEEYFEADGPDDDGKYTLAYQDDYADLLDFPEEELGLPAGSAQVKNEWTNKVPGEFEWVNPANVMEANTVAYANIMFPPELCYWANSPIRISNMEGVAADQNYYPVGGDATTPNWVKWNDDNSWLAKYGWDATKTAVDKETRAVAMKNNVLYGNAVTKVTVKTSAEKLADNRKALVPHVSDQEITVAGKFKVKGILIGGQPKQVEWNFVAASQADRTGVVYDNVTGTPAVSTTASAPFYVTVFDNYNPDNDNPDVVYFAIELENNAGDFYGKDNIIYDGGTFYIAGKMELTADQKTALSTGDLKTLADKGYRIPPVDNTGKMTATPRVFIQDFMTNLNITLGPNALKNAYATIPDLRPIEMYFGLSVDLSWKAGATFDVELGPQTTTGTATGN